ncbi:MAG: hypothetical protein Q8R35_01045 [bacterium]|nr:hypothetical protein [bacterium]
MTVRLATAVLVGFCVCFRPASLGADPDFPPALKFLAALPVTMHGECFLEPPKIESALPCELRVEAPADGGAGILYLIIYNKDGRGFHAIMRIGPGENLTFPFPDP